MKAAFSTISLLLLLPALQAPLATPAWAAPTGVQCMVETAAIRFPLVILVTPTQVDAMVARGYVVKPCEGKENSAPKYQKGICKFAETAPDEMKGIFEQTHRISPGELCSMAGSLNGN